MNERMDIKEMEDVKNIEGEREEKVMGKNMNAEEGKKTQCV